MSDDLFNLNDPVDVSGYNDGKPFRTTYDGVHFEYKKSEPAKVAREMIDLSKSWDNFWAVEVQDGIARTDDYSRYATIKQFLYDAIVEDKDYPLFLSFHGKPVFEVRSIIRENYYTGESFLTTIFYEFWNMFYEMKISHWDSFGSEVIKQTSQIELPSLSGLVSEPTNLVIPSKEMVPIAAGQNSLVPGDLHLCSTETLYRGSPTYYLHNEPRIVPNNWTIITFDMKEGTSRPPLLSSYANTYLTRIFRNTGHEMYTRVDMTSPAYLFELLYYAQRGEIYTNDTDLFWSACSKWTTNIERSTWLSKSVWQYALAETDMLKKHQTFVQRVRGNIMLCQPVLCTRRNVPMQFRKTDFRQLYINNAWTSFSTQMDWPFETISSKGVLENFELVVKTRFGESPVIITQYSSLSSNIARSSLLFRVLRNIEIVVWKKFVLKQSNHRIKDDERRMKYPLRIVLHPIIGVQPLFHFPGLFFYGKDQIPLDYPHKQWPDDGRRLGRVQTQSKIT